MPVSPEIFALVINVIGLPLCWLILRKVFLPGGSYLLMAYFTLLLSNIFTVVEEIWLPTICNLLEHAFISISSILIFCAVLRLVSATRRPTQARNDGSPGEDG